MTWGAIGGGGGGTSSATYTVTDALILGAASPSGVRLDLETGALAVREGDDSAYAPVNCGVLTVPDGTAGAPAIKGTDADTGLVFGSGTLDFSVNGTSRVGLTATTMYVNLSVVGNPNVPINNFINRVSAKTSDATVFGNSTNDGPMTVFTNEGASGAINLTLTNAASGLHGKGIVQAAQYLRFTAASGDTIRDGGTVSASGGYIRSNVVGSTICLQAINATEWIVVSKTGTWTVDS